MVTARFKPLVNGLMKKGRSHANAPFNIDSAVSFQFEFTPRFFTRNP